MTTFVIEIAKHEINNTPKAPFGYYVTVIPRLKSPGVGYDEATQRPTQTGAIAEVDRKLTQYAKEGDDFEYNGAPYLTIKDAVDAVTVDQPNWV